MVKRLMVLKPSDIYLRVKFHREPEDIDWTQETKCLVELAGEGRFLWTPGMSIDSAEDDLRIRVNHEFPYYPLREPPFYVGRDVAIDRLNYLRKKYKKLSHWRYRHIRQEIAYLEDMLKKRRALLELLGLVKED